MNSGVFLSLLAALCPPLFLVTVSIEVPAIDTNALTIASPECDLIFRERFWLIFIRTFVIEFSCDLIFRERFWLIFIRTFVIEFRQIDGNVEIECDLIFRERFWLIFIRTFVIEFRQIDGNVEIECDLIFRERFWLIFIRTFVIEFRQIDGNVEIEVGLEFNTTTDQIPTADVVVYTITEALNNPNNTFNLTLDPNSITVIPTLGKPFVKELKNRSSEQYRELERQVVTMCDLIFRERFWLIFIRTFVIEFRQIDGNVEIECDLIFRERFWLIFIRTFVIEFRCGSHSNLGKTICKELKNRSSEQYRELERQVVTMCDLIFRERFWLIFIRTFVIEFRQIDGNVEIECDLIFRERFWLIFIRTFVIEFRQIDGNVEIEVGLEFNTTTDQIPTADVVVYTITEALNNPNNTFNLTLDPNSITVILVVLTATLERPFVKELKNRSSEQYRELERQVVTMCDLIFRERFWLIFIRTFVIEFRCGSHSNLGKTICKRTQNRSSEQYRELERQVVTMCDLIFRERFWLIFIRTFVIEFRQIDGNVEIEVGLEFNTTTDQIPTADVVVYTITEALNNPNNTFNLTLDPNSITVIFVVLTATLGKPFVKELKNRSSEQYRELERQVVTMCDLIFRERFWLIFIRTFVIEFRQIDGNVEIEVGLEFNTTTDQIPTADVVVYTITEALNNPNNTFNLTLDPNSITVILVVLTATLERPFVKELKNRSSEQYRELERQVVTMCDLIFRERFWLIFIRTFVIEFRQIDGNVEIEVGLEFNTTTDQIPTADVVVYTITEALNNPNNTFNLTLDPNSITVILVVLTATLERPFVKELKNRSSEQYRELERQVVTMCDLIFRERFWLIFIRTFVIEFRQIDGNVEIEVGLEFNTTTDQIPTADVVVYTITEALNNPNNTFNLTLDPNSITVILVVLTATLERPFVKELKNRSSEQYRELERQVVTMCDLIFRERFWLIFIRTFVIEFRQIDGNVEIEVGLEFNTTTDQIPTADVVVYTITEALNNPNNTFNLTLDPNSITVILVVLTATLERPFVKELKNRSSEQYRELERQVVTMCDLIFRERFWLIFIRTFVIEFRPIEGKVEIEVGLEFNTTTNQIPEADVVVDTITEALNNPNNFNLTIDPNSITVILVPVVILLDDTMMAQPDKLIDQLID
ncbi:hypothetical protein KUDE01_014356 [Dissostichus eleginoides]|uniref:Mucin-1 n=1 Tax=Dissostichus eleginoides TaxID=100907 RepID=A0AAD9BVT7_DISEL|nr:hypothetical protein KUDE01_014356 [Dissostichus eleginoides]